MGSSRFWLKAADEESKSIPHELPRSHWLKATGQCVLECYMSATMAISSFLTFESVMKLRIPSISGYHVDSLNSIEIMTLPINQYLKIITFTEEAA